MADNSDNDQSYNLPQPENTTNRYRYVLSDKVDETFFSNDGNFVTENCNIIDFKPGMLVWVLKSKGKRGSKKMKAKMKHEQTKNGNKIEFNESPTLNAGEKKELFLRARVVSVDKFDEEYPNENIDARDSLDNTKMERRILVRYPKGSTYHVRESFLIPVLEPNSDVIFREKQEEPIVLVTPETPEYRRVSAVHTCVGDSFLEIGCDFGICVDRVRKVLTEVKTVPIIPCNDDSYCDLAENNELNNGKVCCIGIDKSPTSLDIAEERYPDTLFSLEDALTDEGTAKLRTFCKDNLIGGHPSVVAIDINGNREIADVIHCIKQIMNPGPDVTVGKDWELPRIIIVKSRYLYRYIFQNKN